MNRFALIFPGHCGTVPDFFSALTPHDLEQIYRDFAIQNALDWDADHLYSFFLNGKSGDRHYEFTCPCEGADPPFADEAVIGELGLSSKCEFLYLFDYGDCHEFMVKVVDILPKREGAGDYPLVVDSRGEAPDQYPNWEDEE
jgi:hypothetical protein